MDTICIVVSNSLTKDPRVIKQIKTAIKFNYNCIFIGFKDDNYDYEFLENLSVKYDLVDLPDKYKGKLSSLLKKINRTIYMYSEYKRLLLKYNPDIIHANDFDILIPSYLASKKLRAGIVYDSHEIWIENNEFQKRKIYKKLMFLIEKHIIKKVDNVISVSYSSAEYLHNCYRIPMPQVITNCPIKNYRINPKKTKFVVLYHGLITPNRGYEEFVLSSKYLNENISLVLRGYGSLKSKIIDIINENNLGKNVTIEEPVEIDELIPFASRSHIGVVLTKPTNINYKLTISNKVFEYVHAGLPVIMSDIPEHRLLNDKFNFGIILETISPITISQAINSLYTDSKLYLSLIDGAKKMAAEMTWEKEEKKLLFIYDGIKNEKS